LYRMSGLLGTYKYYIVLYNNRYLEVNISDNLRECLSEETTTRKVYLQRPVYDTAQMFWKSILILQRLGAVIS
jgi:hypothetical protein